MNQNPPEGIRKPVLYAVWLLILAVIVAVAAFNNWFTRKPSASQPTENADAAAEQKPGYTRPKPIHTVNASDAGEPGATAPDSPTTGQPAARPKAPVAPSTPSPPRPAPSPETRGLVSALASLDLKAPLTAETAAAWRENLARLVQNGGAALPAIQEFLALNKDVNFESIPGGAGLLGSTSLRMSLLEAMGNISGPEALATSALVLQSTTDPREIALLARNLERQAPEQYRDAALAAARTAMAEATAGRLAGKDIGPLFDVLRTYGGPNAVQDFQQAATGQWKYYATIALAELPDGAGVPALLQLVAEPSGSAGGGRVPAIQALAQLVPDYPEARDALLEQAKRSAIPNATWINIAAALIGDRFQIGSASAENNSNLRTWHLAYGNQNYYATPTPLSAEQMQQRLGLIDQFLAVNVNNAFATASLLEAKSRLLARQTVSTQ
jgi:hypothetical protein